MAESPFITQQREALLELLDFLGEPVIHNGTTYKGVVNEVESSNDLRNGGDLETLATIIVLARCHFTASTAPRAGQKLTYDGSLFRISRVDRDPVSFRLTCVTADT